MCVEEVWLRLDRAASSRAANALRAVRRVASTACMLAVRRDARGGDLLQAVRLPGERGCDIKLCERPAAVGQLGLWIGDERNIRRLRKGYGATPFGLRLARSVTLPDPRLATGRLAGPTPMELSSTRHHQLLLAHFNSGQRKQAKYRLIQASNRHFRRNTGVTAANHAQDSRHSATGSSVLLKTDSDTSARTAYADTITLQRFGAGDQQRETVGQLAVAVDLQACTRI